MSRPDEGSLELRLQHVEMSAKGLKEAIRENHDDGDLGWNAQLFVSNVQRLFAPVSELERRLLNRPTDDGRLREVYDVAVGVWRKLRDRAAVDKTEKQNLLDKLERLLGGPIKKED